MEPQHCCERLRDEVDFRCDQHPEDGGCQDYLIEHSPQFDEYGIWVHDRPNSASSSVIVIAYCPFCGSSLPASHREEWFDRLEQMGLEPEEAPEDMTRYRWWRQ